MTNTTTSGGSLQARPFTSLPTLIPELVEGRFEGQIVKIEQVLLRTLQGGARLHVWLRPDPRPHNHPWGWIACTILRGEYTALEYHPSANDSFVERVVHLVAGDPEHRVLHHVHHQISSVTPGTVSLMSFGPVVGDGKQWGHLVPKAQVGGFTYEPAEARAAGFVDALWHCNPHLRPANWHDPYATLPVPSVEALLASVGL